MAASRTLRPSRLDLVGGCRRGRRWTVLIRETSTSTPMTSTSRWIARRVRESAAVSRGCRRAASRSASLSVRRPAQVADEPPRFRDDPAWGAPGRRPRARSGGRCVRDGVIGLALAGVLPGRWADDAGDPPPIRSRRGWPRLRDLRLRDYSPLDKSSTRPQLAGGSGRTSVAVILPGST